MPCIYDESPFEKAERSAKARQVLDDATRAACTAVDLLVNEFDVDLGELIEGDDQFADDMAHLNEWWRQHQAADREREAQLTASKAQRIRDHERKLADAQEALNAVLAEEDT